MKAVKKILREILANETCFVTTQEKYRNSSTSSVLYIDKATPPAPVKLNTSRSICSSFPSTNMKKEKEKNIRSNITHTRYLNDHQQAYMEP
jgi:hypothetical protein